MTRISAMRPLVLLFWLFSFSLASANTRPIQPGNEAELWAGVGILTVAGGGFCSAALINERTVLTAAHCIYRGDGEIASPEHITFNAGWRDGITAAKRSATRIIANRGYDPDRIYGAANIRADLAIVELDEPIPGDAARSYKTMDRVSSGTEVSIVSFSGRRSDVASISVGCEVAQRQGDILSLTCPSYSGMSGAPLFGFVNGQPRILGLISGSSTDPNTGKNTGLALAIRTPLGRVLVDAKAVASRTGDAMPFWASRSTRALVTQPVAARKTVQIGSGMSALTGGTGSGRKVVRPPSN